LELAIYDRDVSLAKLIGANKEYIEREIPHVAQLMRSSVDEVLKACDVVVIGNSSEEFRQMESEILRGHDVIDLVRVFGSRVSTAAYNGICW
jgi:GDP-mannose 6-dehydrogenase